MRATEILSRGGSPAPSGSHLAWGGDGDLDSWFGPESRLGRQTGIPGSPGAGWESRKEFPLPLSQEIHQAGARGGGQSADGRTEPAATGP